MADNAFKVWRVLEETESEDKKVRTITKKEFVGEIENPKEEIYITWMELVERSARDIISSKFRARFTGATWSRKNNSSARPRISSQAILSSAKAL